jgi:hypothetical protein
MVDPLPLGVCLDQPGGQLMVLDANITATYLIVDQSPLLQEPMNPHDSSHITSQIPPTSRNSQILSRVQPIGIDHEIPIILVDTRRLASVPIGEEFR